MNRIFAVLGLVLLGFTACDRPKSPPPAGRVEASDTNLSSPPGNGPGEVSTLENTSTLHWLGRKRIAADTNAATVMAIWNLPETAKLGAQTLDKLALAPWRLLKGDAATNGAPGVQLRPLLDDLVTEEFHLTIHHPTNQTGAWSLAVKLPLERARLWQTNLAGVLESLTGATAEKTADGFTLTSPALLRSGSGPGAATNSVATISSQPSTIPTVQPGDVSNPIPASNCVFRLARTNDWTVLTCAPPGSEPTFRPPPSATTNWLALTVDLAAINRAFGFAWPLPANPPHAKLSVAGIDQGVSTRGRFVFDRALDLPLEPWNVPTNLLSEPLVSFTAVRGLRPWLASLAPVRHVGIKEPPNQLFQWGLGGAPFFTYFAAPSPDASNQVAQLADYLVSDFAPRLQARGGLGSIDRVASANAVAWTGLPYIGPRLMSVPQPGGDFIRLGFFPPTAVRPVPPELLYSLTARSNLLAYDWELTGARVDGLTGLIQILRLGSGHARISPYSAGMTWLRAAKTNLVNCTTGVLLESPATLSVSRTSSLGLTALEMQLLVDWLESPAFPRGLHTLLAPPEPAVAAPSPLAPR